MASLNWFRFVSSLVAVTVGALVSSTSAAVVVSAPSVSIPPGDKFGGYFPSRFPGGTRSMPSHLIFE
ncbi:MAG: hypothetical protein KatS3mg104_1922 [Phycisphaerae bacterium]|nr:MAG: hypothetical protein KatS3mg104_1922 [Phycisphaerae bacterium]